MLIKIKYRVLAYRSEGVIVGERDFHFRRLVCWYCNMATCTAPLSAANCFAFSTLCAVLELGLGFDRPRRARVRACVRENVCMCMCDDDVATSQPSALYFALSLSPIADKLVCMALHLFNNHYVQPT